MKARPEQKEKKERKEKKSRRPKIKIRLSLGAVAVLAAVFLIIADPVFHIPFGLVRTSKTAISKFILEKARPLFSLHTVEYSVKTVFPYDYEGRPGLLLEALKKKLRNKQLTEEEKTLGELLYLMADINFPINSRKHEFVIINARLRAGYNFALDEKSTEEEIRKKVSSLIDYDYKSKTVNFKFPKPEIVDVIIEDFTPENYNFPDISFSPAEWKKVAGFVARNLKTHSLTEKILDEAEKNTKQLLTELFLSGGWEHVIFFKEEDSIPQQD